MAKFAKGNPGRPKGSTNKMPKTVKAMILEVTDGLGGADRLLKWAENNEGEFYTKLLTRLIPTESSVTVEDVSDPRRLTNDQLAHIAAGGSIHTAPAPVSNGKPH